MNMVRVLLATLLLLAVGAALYPHPPNLAQQDPPDPRRAFWVIKHGIKMSAMPAWEKSLDDAAIWEVVSFVRTMPGMTPETYREISRQSPPATRNGNS
jgi:mono/diheme cytochrome c family protein